VVAPGLAVTGATMPWAIALSVAVLLVMGGLVMLTRPRRRIMG